jgi:hypothetical protein
MYVLGVPMLFTGLWDPCGYLFFGFTCSRSILLKKSPGKCLRCIYVYHKITKCHRGTTSEQSKEYIWISGQNLVFHWSLSWSCPKKTLKVLLYIFWTYYNGYLSRGEETKKEVRFWWACITSCEWTPHDVTGLKGPKSLINHLSIDVCQGEDFWPS